jgi:2'-5' RNA ligase superfamily
MLKHILTALLCAGSFQFGVVAQGAPADSSIVAINVLLLPDAHMTEHARDLNRQLRSNDPSGFALDDTHVPHISLVHQYVRSQDLPRVLEIVQRIAARSVLPGREVTANGLEHQGWNARESISLVVQKTSEMQALQRELIAALRPYKSDSGGADAFVRDETEADIDPATIEYVTTFAEKRTGDNFKPHITLGFGDVAFADELKAMEAKAENFKIADIAVFQLGNAGTARKKLWSLSSH